MQPFVPTSLAGTTDNRLRCRECRVTGVNAVVHWKILYASVTTGCVVVSVKLGVAFPSGPTFVRVLVLLATQLGPPFGSVKNIVCLSTTVRAVVSYFFVTEAFCAVEPLVWRKVPIVSVYLPPSSVTVAPSTFFVLLGLPFSVFSFASVSRIPSVGVPLTLTVPSIFAYGPIPLTTTPSLSVTVTVLIGAGCTGGVTSTLTSAQRGSPGPPQCPSGSAFASGLFRT